MPIRTGRGRAAVYRTLWGWPLRSPRHLAAAVAGGVLLVVLLGLVLAGGPGDGAAPAPSRTAASAGAGAGDDGPPAGAGGPRAPAGALDAADGFVRAMTTTPDGLTPDEWVEQVSPYATQGLLPDLRTVDPANVPDGEVAGPPRTVAAGTGTAVVDVPTTAAVVRVDLVDTPGGWRVASYERAG